MARHENILCAGCGIRESGIFQGLEDEHFAAIDREKSVATYHPGQVLCAEGAPGGPVFCVHRGLVKLQRTDDRGEAHILRLLGPTDTIGVRALVTDDPFPATAVAVDRTVACVIPRETFRRLLGGSRPLADEVMRRLAGEIRQAEERMLAFTQRSARRRLAHLLLHLDDHGRNWGDGGAQRLLRRKDLARMIGMTPETFSRLLRKFRDRGLIDVDRREIRVLDRAGLDRVATKSGAILDQGQEFY